MTNEEKIMKFRQLLSNINVTDSYEVLEETGDLKSKLLGLHDHRAYKLQ